MDEPDIDVEDIGKFLPVCILQQLIIILYEETYLLSCMKEICFINFHNFCF